MLFGWGKFRTITREDGMRKSTLIVYVFLLMSVQGFAQKQVTVTHNVNLRPDPSTKEAPIAVVSKGSQVTLVEPSTTRGFKHVRTSDGKEGWISATSISSSGKGLKAASGKTSKRKLVRKPE